MRFWDPATGATTWTLPLGPDADRADRPDRLQAIAVAPDLSWFAGAGADRTVRVWDSAGTVRHALREKRHGPLTRLAPGPDGKWPVSADEYGQVRVWDLATGAGRWLQRRPSVRVVDLAVAADGSWLATASWDGVRIKDVATGKTRKLMRTATTARSVAISADGGWLAASCHDRVLLLWRTAGRGSTTPVALSPGGLPVSLAFSPDGRWLAGCGHDDSVWLWSAPDGGLASTSTVGSPVATSPIGGLVATSPVAACTVGGPASHCSWLDGGTVLCVAGPAGCTGSPSRSDHRSGRQTGPVCLSPDGVRG